MGEPEIRIVGQTVTLTVAGTTATTATLPDVLQALAGAMPHRSACEVLPDGARIVLEREDAVGLAVEVAPHARHVRWLASGSRSDFGPGARYAQYYLSLPYLVLLVVLRHGALTGWHQLYYRRAPLAAGDDLLLPNLYNVARAYGQHAWCCLVNMADVSALSYPAKVHAVLDHVLTAAWNRSADVHEGNSYFSLMQDLDPRVSSPERWQEETRRNPLFALDVAWKPARLGARAELARMLDQVVAPPRLGTAADLAGIIARAAGASRRGRP